MNTAITVPESLSVLDQSIYLARHINTAVDTLRPLVYQVAKDELWKERFSSFGEYVESPEGLNYNSSGASKLKTIEQFRLDNGFSEKEVNGIAVESLYLSIKAGGEPKLILSRAQTLSRNEIKMERLETEPHPFEANPNCRTCGLAKSNHPL